MNLTTYQRRVSVGATRAYLQRLRQTATQVDLTRLMALSVELVFENVETVTIEAAAVTDFWLLPGETVPATDLVGFELQVAADPANFHAQTFATGKARLSDGRDRVLAFQDVMQLIVHTATTDRHYSVTWNPLSAVDQENLNQHVALTSETLTLWAWPVPITHWTDILPAATDSLNFAVMVGELTTQLGDTYDETQVRTILTTALTELRSFSDLAQPTTQQHIVVRYQPRHADRPWTEQRYDDADGQDHADLYLWSYPELLGMDLTLPADHFWEGVAWLLWEITFSGAEALERQQTIERFQDDLVQGDQAEQDFRAQTTKMKRFWDAYVSQHVTAPDLAATVAHFWPLTTGTPVSGPVVSQRQDPQLLAEFMARFGAAYRKFDGDGQDAPERKA
ncbi:hypothetical protein [Levilactobacillus zymae]|uniref:Uncharacterized protein n=1 Tax=Levilactobacillus zymae TaxID=267363 RepID=A0A1Y6JXH4_9LACO|nr:hypothetical protein [Levilactobacillus zymae]SMS13821.1 hypothetical protein LZ3411_0771 [Levilactobacillus zymae]